jgi:hypothetical protein
MRENFIQLKDYIRRLRSVAINQDTQIESIRRHLLPDESLESKWKCFGTNS